MSTAAFRLPRVTYTSTAVDLAPIHEMFDRELPQFRATLGKRFANRVAGAEEWEGETYEVKSPGDSRLLIGTFVEPSPAVIAKAGAAARKASAIWGAMPWQERVAIMRKFSQAVDKQKYEMAKGLVFQSGKTRLEALSEGEEAVDLIEHYCKQMEKHNGFVEPAMKSGPAEEAQVRLRPFGVFAVIAPFNYPVALLGNMIGAALVAGNTVILKASPESGLTADMFVRAGEEAGLPKGALNLLFGEQAGPRLVEQPGIDGVAFTGSNKTGMAILRRMAQGPFMRPVIGELGGKNHAYVTRTANVEAAVEGVAKAAFAFQGQKCSACSVAFVHSSIYLAFVDALAKRAATFAPGNTEKKTVNCGPLINADAVARYEDAVEHGKKAGRIVYGGKRLSGGDYEYGYFVEPAIIADLPADDRIHKDEIFAPIVAVRPFDSLEKAIAEGNALDVGLTAGIFSSDPAEIDYFQANVEAGVVYINRRMGATTGAWPGIQSFCGWKGSGLTGKGGLGPHYLPQFMREQCVTKVIG